jgi:predicted NAD/FAD-dependent oxidoreductase
MSAVPRVLARGLDIVAGTRIVGTAREEGTWRLRDDSGRTHGPFAVLLLATPAAQAQALLEGASERLRSAATVSMHPSWALMVLVDAGATIDHDAAFVADSPLRWVMRQASKPGRSSPFDGWVLHATPQWSAAHFETPTEHVHAALLEAWAQRGGPSASRVRVVSSHRWRYALADSQPGDAAVYDTAEGLGLAGDWLGGARVEGAFLSGRALAARVLWQTRAAQDD